MLRRRRKPHRLAVHLAANPTLLLHMKKGLETWLYSTLGVVAMLVILVAINVIAARAKTARRSHRGARLHALARHAGHPREARYAGADPFLLHARRERDAGRC